MYKTKKAINIAVILVTNVPNTLPHCLVVARVAEIKNGGRHPCICLPYHLIEKGFGISDNGRPCIHWPVSWVWKSMFPNEIVCREKFSICCNREPCVDKWWPCRGITSICPNWPRRWDVVPIMDVHLVIPKSLLIKCGCSS